MMDGMIQMGVEGRGDVPLLEAVVDEGEIQRCPMVEKGTLRREVGGDMMC
jgi:hypothetical protein